MQLSNFTKRLLVAHLMGWIYQVERGSEVMEHKGLSWILAHARLPEGRGLCTAVALPKAGPAGQPARLTGERTTYNTRLCC